MPPRRITIPMEDSPFLAQQSPDLRSLRAYIHSEIADEEVDSRDRLKNLSGNKKTLLTCLKSFVGSGILFLPHGFKQAGLVAGTVTLLFVGFVSTYCMLILLENRVILNQRIQAQSSVGEDELLADVASNTRLLPPLHVTKPIKFYADIGKAAYGKPGSFAVKTCVILSQMGFCCVYIAFIANVSDSVLKEANVFEQNPWSLDTYMYMVTPFLVLLSYVRYLKFFSYLNLVGDLFIIISLVYVVVYSVQHAEDEGRFSNWDCTPDDINSACYYLNNKQYMLFFGCAVYSFEGITMVLPIQNSMKKPQDLPRIMLFVGIFLTFLLTGFGSVCFYIYGAQINNVILNNLPLNGRIVVTIMYVSIALFMFPLMMFPARIIVENALFEEQRRSGRKWLKNLVRTVLVLLCLMVSVLAGDRIDKLVALIGGTCCIPLALIFPPLFYLKTGCAVDFWRQKFPNYLICGFGIISSFLSTLTAIQQWSVE